MAVLLLKQGVDPRIVAGVTTAGAVLQHQNKGNGVIVKVLYIGRVIGVDTRPPGPTAASLHGHLVKNAGSDDIWLIECGQRRLLWNTGSHKEVFNYRATNSFPGLMELPLGPPVKHGYLAKAPTSDHVYWIDNGVKRHIANPTVFTEFGFHGPGIKSMTQGQLDNIPSGPAVQ